MLTRTTNIIIIAIILDILSIVLAVTLANWLRLNLPYGRPLPFEPGLKILFWQALFLYPLIFLLFSIYDPERTFRAVDEYQLLIGACFIAALALAGVVYFTARDISRLFLVYFYITHFLSVVSWRALMRLVRQSLYERGHDLRRVLLIGGGEAASQALDRLNEMAWAGIQLVGYITDGESMPPTKFNVPHLGNLTQTEITLQKNKVDDVLVALPAESYNKIQHLVTKLINQPCNVWVVPDYFSLLIYGAHVNDLGGVPMISIKAPTLAGYRRVVKRAFDLAVGSLMMLLALPVMGIIALAIRIDSKGPVLFRQQRVGENRRLFMMYKFRSMVENADERLDMMFQSDNNGNLIHKLPNDPRLTRVGRIIRRTSLDELPQLINVLKGEMSLVGPRPEMPIFVDKYEAWQLQRFAVPQGITGWWQINGRSEKPMHLHTEDDIYYVQNYSLLLDIQILAKTIGAVIRRKGAF